MSNEFNFDLNIISKVKVVILGEQSVGKTSIITRFVYDQFESSYQATIGIDFLSKEVNTLERRVRLQLWDTAGQERFRSLIPSYIRDSMVAIVVFDISDVRTFQQIDKWVEAVRTQRRDDALIFMVGNKTDLNDKRQVSSEEAILKANELKISMIETSAKTGFNVKNLFRNIVDDLPIDLFTKTVPKEVEVRLKSNNDIVVTPSDHCSSMSYCWH